MGRVALVGVCLQFLALVRVQYEIVRTPAAVGPLSFGAIATAVLTFISVLLLHTGFPRLALVPMGLNLLALTAMLGSMF